MNRLKFEGLEIGTVIKAYDFQPRSRNERYVIGEIIAVNKPSNEIPFSNYLVRVDEDTLHEDEKRSFVNIPMESTFDYNDRITVVKWDKEYYEEAAECYRGF